MVSFINQNLRNRCSIFLRLGGGVSKLCHADAAAQRADWEEQSQIECRAIYSLKKSKIQFRLNMSTYLLLKVVQVFVVRASAFFHNLSRLWKCWGNLDVRSYCSLLMGSCFTVILRQNIQSKSGQKSAQASGSRFCDSAVLDLQCLRSVAEWGRSGASTGWSRRFNTILANLAFLMMITKCGNQQLLHCFHRDR